MRKRSRWNLKVGLALGGGAARGVAHVGILRELERAGIPIDLIVGTSMGAIIGGAYAANPDADALEAEVRSVLGSEEFHKNRLSFLKETKKQRGGLLFSVANLVRKGVFFGVSNMRQSFLSAEAFANSMARILPESKIEDAEIPFAAATLDIERAEEVILTRGDLRLATAASSAIPGILPPIEWNGRLLMDGGWVDKVPVLPAFKLGADIVIAVDISADVDTVASFRKGIDIMVRANAIKDAALVAFSRKLANLVIEPEVRHIHWADFGAYDTCIEEGARAAQGAVGPIKEILRQERLLSFVRPAAKKRMADLNLNSDGIPLIVE